MLQRHHLQVAFGNLSEGGHLLTAASTFLRSNLLTAKTKERNPYSSCLHGSAAAEARYGQCISLSESSKRN
ncbi:Uncharacterized protein HZ326_28008 [Fusarium oxysporum f. sp. albedinis]|nr:Uncharacterized protein HZ326_28008 [Fusarium oxysporum f. sp. albedinis]